MDYDKIRELVKKYWKGETDLSEETLLKEFFAENDHLPDDLQPEKHLFDHYRSESKKSVFSEDLTAKLKRRWATENQPVIIKLSRLKSMMHYAAILVSLLLPGYFLLNKYKDEQSATVQTDTFDDPQKAIAETEKVLLLLSKNMNNGLSKIETIKLFNEVKVVKSSNNKFHQ